MPSKPEYLVGFTKEELEFVISALRFELNEYYEPYFDWWQFENRLLKKLEGKL